MKYMLDTCSFIWYLTKDKRLPETVRKMVYDSGEIYMSFATLWEIAIKQTVGKLDIITMNIYELADFCENRGILIMPLKFSYLEKIKHMPLIHRDPFDRIIMATAIEENCTLITNDSEIIKYDGIKTFWENT